nr:hypothetical protein Iba_chr03bCG1630 [Ipomoea batatas]
MRNQLPACYSANQNLKRDPKYSCRGVLSLGGVPHCVRSPGSRARVTRTESNSLSPSTHDWEATRIVQHGTDASAQQVSSDAASSRWMTGQGLLSSSNKKDGAMELTLQKPKPTASSFSLCMQVCSKKQQLHKCQFDSYSSSTINPSNAGSP